MKAKLVILALTISALLLIFWGIKRQSNVVFPIGKYLEATETSRKTFVSLPLREPFKKEVSVQDVNWDAISATSIVAFNPVTSKEYFQRNSSAKRPIASITKLMTALVAMDEYNLEEDITLSKGVSIQDRNLGLQVGDKVLVSELIEAMLVASKNDAAEILAQEYLGGYKQFIQLMNEKAVFLGMNDSHFSNASGFIDEDNYSTADDLKILVSAFLTSEHLKATVSQKTATFVYLRANQTLTQNLPSTNELFGAVGNIKGLKTGYTVKSGPSFIGYFVSSNEDQLVTIMLDSPDRFGETKQLLNLIQKSFKY